MSCQKLNVEKEDLDIVENIDYNALVKYTREVIEENPGCTVRMNEVVYEELKRKKIIDPTITKNGSLGLLYEAPIFLDKDGVDDSIYVWI